MRYLNGTAELCLTLAADGSNIVRWYGDASFAVHSDMKSHTGGVMTMGSGRCHQRVTQTEDGI